jgi:hypothetical protein
LYGQYRNENEPMLIVDRTGHSTEKVTTHGASRTAPAMQDLCGMNFTAPER